MDRQQKPAVEIDVPLAQKLTDDEHRFLDELRLSDLERASGCSEEDSDS